jgi:SAM-dependent methyltransferase
MSLLEKKIYPDKWFISDVRFNMLYASSIQALAARHWTPLTVARRVANFLACEDGARVLDIGSGVGKFCLAAAHYRPNALYYGIEQRKSLINHSKKALKVLKLENVFFTHGNFTQLDFKNFDHFYFYNSFFENLPGAEKIDDSIDYSGELYDYYNSYLHKQLELKPAGTRVATFHSFEGEIPQSYHEVGAEFDNDLKLWIKFF